MNVSKSDTLHRWKILTKPIELEESFKIAYKYPADPPRELLPLQKRALLPHPLSPNPPQTPPFHTKFHAPHRMTAIPISASSPSSPSSCTPS